MQFSPGGTTSGKAYAHARTDRVLSWQFMILQRVRFWRLVLERVWFLVAKVY